MKGGHKDNCLPKFDAGFRDHVHEGGRVIVVGLHSRCYLPSKETDMRLISGVAVMSENAAVYRIRTQHCVTMSTTEAEYVALAEGAKKGMFVRSVMSSMQPNVYKITLMKHNEGAKEMSENSLSLGRS